MDPRLWKLLDLSPGALYIQNVHLSHNESTLTLDCRAISDAYPKGRAFQIMFKNCRDVRWQAVDPHANESMPQALGLYLGEEEHHKPAVVYTGSTEMTVLYNELVIDWK
jgi:hypothetical protein